MTSEAQPISSHEKVLRVFFIGYMRHKKLMYINYMEKAQIWASFLGVQKDELLAEEMDFLDAFPRVSSHDICRRCACSFGTTFGGRLRDGCANCTVGWHPREVSDYEVQQLCKILGISYGWTEIFVARILSCHYPQMTS